ncbi:DUF3263 domain-containing protein [Rhodococcus triatomae]
MDGRRDREILDHALRWAPYTGGDDHIWIDFGLTPVQFYRRLAQLLESPVGSRIDPATRKVLHKRCQRAAIANEVDALDPLDTTGLHPANVSSSHLTIQEKTR